MDGGEFSIQYEGPNPKENFPSGLSGSSPLLTSLNYVLEGKLIEIVQNFFPLLLLSESEDNDDIMNWLKDSITESERPEDGINEMVYFSSRSGLVLL